jgi:hypothetical protein
MYVSTLTTTINPNNKKIASNILPIDTTYCIYMMYFFDPF